MSVFAGIIFLGLGMAASWEDCRYRRVSNRWIVAGLLASGAGYGILGLNTFLGARGIVLGWVGEYYLPASFYGGAAVHFFLGIVSAVCLWYLRIWPAGDAKLFIVCGSLLVLMNHNLRGFPDRLFFLTLCNIFAAGAIFVLGLILWECFAILARLRPAGIRVRIKPLAHRAWTRLLDERGRAHKYGLFAWNTFALFFAARIVWDFFGVGGRGLWGALASYALLYLAWGKIRNFFLRWDVAGISFFVVSGVLLPWDYWHGWSLFPQLKGGGGLAFGFWFFLPIANTVLSAYLQSARTMTLGVDALAPGMILSDKSFRQLGALSAEALPHFQYSDGLSGEEAALIQRTFRAKDGLRVEIQSPKPFAPWVFLGCLWTALFQRTILECLIQKF